MEKILGSKEEKEQSLKSRKKKEKDKTRAAKDSLKKASSTSDSDEKKAAKYRQMMRKGNKQLADMRKNLSEDLAKTEHSCDSEEKLERSKDYQTLLSSSEQLEICRQMHKDISVHTGNGFMESNFKVTQNKRKLENEMLNLHHKEFTIKRKYIEMNPGSEASFFERFKSKTYTGTTHQFKERNGRFVDQET